MKTHPDAVVPYKTRESDVGYDLTLIAVHKKVNEHVTLYDTGLKVKVANGYYLEIVPRSSIIKSGHIMANNIGIIDRSYEGNLYVALAKLGADVKDIELPYRGFQLILRKQVHGVFEEMDFVDSSSRGSGGFGSTGK
jgi:dUTP pyrophosphatase